MPGLARNLVPSNHASHAGFFTMRKFLSHCNKN
jgi:hypothetical protein